MCARQLYVKSNGQWVAALGGGTVVADGLATEQFVTDAIAAIPATDLSGLATLTDLNDALAAIQPGDTDLTDYYTKPEVDAAIASAATGGTVDLSSYALLNSVSQDITANLMKAQSFVFTKSQTSLGFARFPEYPNGKLGIEIGGPGGELQFIAYVSDLSAYAKQQDNKQNLLAKVVTAEGYGFGDVSEPRVAITYTDTGEGYGERLVLATGASIDYVVMKTDLDELNALLPRIEKLESKAAPTVDLSGYVTSVDAEARYETLASGNLLRGQMQAVFDSIYTRAESDARYAEKAKTYTKTECDGKFLTLVDIDQFAYRADVYTQKQCDDRFIRIDQAFSKIDFDNQMALMLYSRKQIDDRIAAINPLGSPSINNPALADFKKSVLDEVKLMLVGGTKMPPADIDWTPIIRMNGAIETVSTEIQVRMLGGFIELRGTLTFLAGTAEWNPLRLPPQFPLADLDASYPLAMRLVGTAVTYGFCSVSSKNRDIRVSPGAKSSEAAFSGIRWKAAY
jgi:hypothetical protein